MRQLEAIALKIPGTEKTMLTVFTRNERGVKFYTKLGYEIYYSPPPKVLRNGTRVEAEYVIMDKAISRWSIRASGVSTPNYTFSSVKLCTESAWDYWARQAKRSCATCGVGNIRRCLKQCEATRPQRDKADATYFQLLALGLWRLKEASIPRDPGARQRTPWISVSNRELCTAVKGSLSTGIAAFSALFGRAGQSLIWGVEMIFQGSGGRNWLNEPRSGLWIDDFGTCKNSHKAGDFPRLSVSLASSLSLPAEFLPSIFYFFHRHSLDLFINSTRSLFFLIQDVWYQGTTCLHTTTCHRATTTCNLPTTTCPSSSAWLCRLSSRYWDWGVVKWHLWLLWECPW